MHKEGWLVVCKLQKQLILAWLWRWWEGEWPGDVIAPHPHTLHAILGRGGREGREGDKLLYITEKMSWLYLSFLSWVILIPSKLCISADWGFFFICMHVLYNTWPSCGVNEPLPIPSQESQLGYQNAQSWWCGTSAFDISGYCLDVDSGKRMLHLKHFLYFCYDFGCDKNKRVREVQNHVQFRSLYQDA